VPTGHIPVTVGGVGKRTLEMARTYADWLNVPIHHLDKLRSR
jgi:alkanesulfonate monooxygenase SsuD/methylene tetrahydromethanopterin reductase-like flavin-dependent oxidoreductase (luciferase family)